VMARGDRQSAADAADIVRRSVDSAIFEDFLTTAARMGGIRDLELIECPVLIAWGTRDFILPARRYSARIREVVPNAQWLSLKGLGHCPMGDDPELIARTIADFVRAATAATPAAAPQPV
jgi:pimeloyl-ACP methyl ester carboxylesterase